MGRFVDGSKMVEQHSRVELVEPWRAGQFDPPMQEWLQLPAADSCPVHADHKEWGTSNPRGYFLVRRCNCCGTKFRPAVSNWMIHDVIEALMGLPRRFGMEDLRERCGVTDA